jgi:hypothetical protein
LFAATLSRLTLYVSSFLTRHRDVIRKPAMANAQDQSSSAPVSFRLPIIMWILGALPICGSAALAAELVLEQTVWTWQRGPQVIFFSLIHTNGIVLFLFPLLLLPWVVVLGFYVAHSLTKKRAIMKHVWLMLGVPLLIFVVLSLPYSFWQKLFVNRLATGPYAGEFLTDAAASGDLGLVKAFISHGFPVDGTNRDGRTALHAAAEGNSIKVLQFLVSRGANLNAIDRSGDSPLEVAAWDGRNEAANFLAAQGAKRIRGDQAQREKARDGIDKMQ